MSRRPVVVKLSVPWVVVVLAALKLAGVIDWPWWLILLSPLILILALVVLVGAAIVAGALVGGVRR